MLNNYTVIDIGALSLAVIGSQLMYLRSQGTEIRMALTPLIAAADNTKVALDFSTVKGIDFSCSDEIVTHFQENPRDRFGKGIVLINLSRNHTENITTALDRKKQAVWYHNSNYWSLLGDKLPKHLTELAIVVKEKKVITARQLADELGEDIHSQSTKLKKLFDHGLVLRTEDKSSEGSQFIYRSIV